jgi:hypothetical protein
VGRIEFWRAFHRGFSLRESCRFKVQPLPAVIQIFVPAVSKILIFRGTADARVCSFTDGSITLTGAGSRFEVATDGGGHISFWEIALGGQAGLDVGPHLALPNQGTSSSSASVYWA